ncbi:ADG1 protein [Trypanosoma theileri]|uniref:ADG1 protein n=1 Tax=Trypanosoma theileri TaxID=67003 RepID=A0A1X0NPM0_9TRYP|nr:ADG1 protein [Trypanosoma theileri]ORC86433.1 ADG1 protein [Trypanosoma theileri]
MSTLTNSPVYKQLFRPLSSNWMLSSCVATGCGSALTYWWYTRKTKAVLKQTQENCQAIAERAFVESRQLLKSLEDDWARDMKSRDTSVRRLELQNVEQTRSIARLDAAMKLCIAPGPQVPE